MEELLNLTCENCGTKYEKPAKFQKWQNDKPNVFFKWSLKYCDSCRRSKERGSLKKLPDVIKAIFTSSDS
jgi:hypothetical protein